MIRVLANRPVDVENFINFLLKNINNYSWNQQLSNEKDNEIFSCIISHENMPTKNITIDTVVKHWEAGYPEHLKYDSIFIYVDGVCLSCKMCPEHTDSSHKLVLAIRNKIEKQKTDKCLDFITNFIQLQSILSGDLK